MTPDVEPAKDPRAFAILLHPHPDFGGNRFHPFVDTVFRRLPEIQVSAVRFDFISAKTATARDEVIEAIDIGTARWPSLRAILCGYSFGAGIAAMVNDDRIAAWYLLAAPLVMLQEAVIGDDWRPKAIVVPKHDQFAPPSAVQHELSTWQATKFETIPGADHFLGIVDPFVDNALAWIDQQVSR